jgi:hypothetical protein
MKGEEALFLPLVSMIGYSMTSGVSNTRSICICFEEGDEVTRNVGYMDEYNTWYQFITDPVSKTKLIIGKQTLSFLLVEVLEHFLLLTRRFLVTWWLTMFLTEPLCPNKKLCSA